MIDANTIVFPNNVVELVNLRLSLTIDPVPDPVNGNVQYYKRPLRPTDPAQSIGVFPVDWLPDDDSKEFRGAAQLGISQPTLSKYYFNVQGFVKDTDQVRGIKVHSIMSSQIRAILYKDNPLRVGLAALQVTVNGYTEKFQRLGVRTQRFITNEIDNAWVYLSTLEFWVETENV